MTWVPETFSIELLIHQEVIGQIFDNPKPSEWPIIPGIQKTFKVGDLVADPEVGFGFGEQALFRKGSRNQLAVFSGVLPVMEYEAGPCIHCGGKRRQVRDCLYCSRTGKSREYRHQLGQSLSLSLSLLLSRMFILDSLPKTEDKQLVTIELAVATRDMHGYPLWGSFSIEMLRWLASPQEQYDLMEVRRAMQQAYNRFFPLQHEGLISFRAWAEPDGRFNFSVPGNCACMHTDHGSWDSLKNGEGYGFGTHNVDVSAQQLSLLVGLIKLWEKARSEIYKEI